MNGKNQILYLKIKQGIETAQETVTLKDIAEFVCTQKEMEYRLATMKILSFHGKKKGRYCGNVIELIKRIRKLYPELEVQNVGVCDYVITYKKSGNYKKWIHSIPGIGIGLLLFMGSAFSIMAFNNDININMLFAQLYEQFTGEKSTGFTVIEICYCIGLSVGILVFFNHFAGKKFSMDPTPLEIQMKLYEKDVNTALNLQKEQENHYE